MKIGGIQSLTSLEIDQVNGGGGEAIAKLVEKCKGLPPEQRNICLAAVAVGSIVLLLLGKK